MFSSFGCQLLAAPGRGVWGVGCKPLASLGGATRGGHVLVFQEQPKTGGYRQDGIAVRYLGYHQGDTADGLAYSSRLGACPFLAAQHIPTMPGLRIADGTA